MNKFLPYCRQSIDASDIESVSQALSSDMITRGPKVAEFEKALATYCGAKHAVAFNSGTTALFAACAAANVNRFDRILTTPNTFIATASCALVCGATPLFIDIDRNTGSIDLEQLQLNLDFQSTRGRNIIIPVHFAGIPIDMTALGCLINEPNTVIIEDAAHALGSSYPDGQKVGSCSESDMTIFSFHPAKTITTGEGGMVTTNSDEYYEKLILYRNNEIIKNLEHPDPWHYDVIGISGNFNFTEIQGALGLSQLKRLDAFIAKRTELMTYYRSKLQNMPHIRLFSQEHDAHTAYHLMVAQIDFNALKTNRSDFMKKLKDQGIGTQVHYIPLYHHPLLAKKMGDISGYFPNTEAYYASALSLPFYYDLTFEDVDRVIKSLTIG